MRTELVMMIVILTGARRSERFLELGYAKNRFISLSRNE